jgi:hypothetical protein
MTSSGIEPATFLLVALCFLFSNLCYMQRIAFVFPKRLWIKMEFGCYCCCEVNGTVAVLIHDTQ